MVYGRFFILINNSNAFVTGVPYHKPPWLHSECWVPSTVSWWVGVLART